jgi:choloylglycine hydrolase
MCTAVNLKTGDHYFGRNLDLDRSYGEEVCIIPQNFPLKFRKSNTLNTHYAIIGMATVVDGTPLFYDAANEYGLAMAGLNFPDNAQYYCENRDKDNICSFEFIPWILSKCKNLSEAKKLLDNINILNIPYSERLPVSPLHWIISYKSDSVVVECMSDGMHIFDNYLGILTNNPPFPLQMFNLNNYRHLSSTNGENKFLKYTVLENYCQGLGGIGLPGDVSSMSRFVRMAFYKENSVSATDETHSVSQFFHLLSSVEMCRGGCLVPSGEYDITVYSSCINTDKGLYYYTTYDNHQINLVDMHCTDLESTEISRYPLILSEQINRQN